jgi:hypothetical protein
MFATHSTESLFKTSFGYRVVGLAFRMQELDAIDLVAGLKKT